MPFTIPDVASAFDAIQARLQSGDLQVISDGIDGIGIVSGVAVSPQGTPDMTVAVASGTVRIGGADVAVSSGNLTVTANATGNPRLDLIVVNGSGTKSVRAGTAASTPKFPSIPGSSVVLAAIYVPSGITAVTANHITDKRQFVSHVHPASEVGSGTIATARLGSGSATSTTFLRGDQTWASLTAGAAYVNHGNTGATETIDVTAGPVHRIVLDASCTLTFTSPSSGVAWAFTLIIVEDATGGRTITWPASVKWPNATAPTWSTTANARSRLVFQTEDGGTTWDGALVGSAFG